MIEGMKPLVSLVGFAFVWLLVVVITMGTALLVIPVYWVLVFRLFVKVGDEVFTRRAARGMVA
jgi:hypothetical protein